MYTQRVKENALSALSEFPVRDRTGLHHHVAGRIGTLIASGDLQPGTVLPNENILCEQLGVSRTVVREAIKVLDSKGLVEVRRKTGTRIRPTTDWNMLDPEMLSWLFAGEAVPSTLAHLLELRRLIEPPAARMAAESATHPEIDKIEAAYRKMEDVTDDIAASVEADLGFHLAILEATHNPFLRSFGSLIKSALRASFRFTSSNHALYLQSLKLHGSVLEAVKNRNGVQAEEAMSTMLVKTRSDIAEQSAWIPARKKSISQSTKKAKVKSV